MELLTLPFEAHEGSIPKLSGEEKKSLSAYFALLQNWNERMALVSRKSMDVAFATHFADSLFICEAVREWSSLPVCDVGSGAGFPGIVFAIRNPESEVTLFDRSTKKQSFLVTAVTTLGLRNVRVEGEFLKLNEPSLVLNRAFMPRPQIFAFFEKKVPVGSTLITCLGSTAEPVNGTVSGFRTDRLSCYSLPLDQGERQVEIFRRVPRETKAV